MPDPHREIDLQGASILITGEGIGPERQAKVYAIGQKLNVRPDDELFTVLVLLESYAHLFSAVPDKMAVAAHDAAGDVGAAARETVSKVLVEAAVDTFDMKAFHRRFRHWMIGAVTVMVVVIFAVSYAAKRSMDRVTDSAQTLYQEEVAKAKTEIETFRASIIQSSSEAGYQAGLAASQATAKVFAEKFAFDLKNSVDQRVADGLNFARDKATLLGSLLQLERQQPGTLKALNELASAGWQALVRANQSGACPTKTWDGNAQKFVCSLWAP